MNRNDPADMSVDQRRKEVAAILAAGFLRLKRRTPTGPCSGWNSQTLTAERRYG